MYDLSKLTEFNPAIVYCFDPEASPQRLSGSETLLDALVPEAGQHEDMLQAYLYAQNNILPVIRAIGFEKVTPSQLIDWIKTLHALIGNSLFKYQGSESGEYTELMLLRWHKGASLNQEFCYYLADQLPDVKTDDAFINRLHNEYKLDKKSCLDFLKLLRKIHNNKTIEISTLEVESISMQPVELHSSLTTLTRMATAYNKDLMTSEEKAMVDKVVKICIFPEQIPGRMESFAKSTIENYSKIDKTDKDQIYKYLAEVFYVLTDIHPFENANGRIATCLINLLLRSFSLPSILLRYPGERSNENSQYYEAIDAIDSTLVPLQKLIKLRVKEALKKPFRDTELEKLISLRVGVSHLVTRIHTKHPKFDTQSLLDGVPPLPGYPMSTNQIMIFNLSSLIVYAGKREKELDEMNTKTQSRNFGISTPVSSDRISQLKSDLEKISGTSGWKVNQKSGLVSWLEVSEMTQAREIEGKLNQTQAITATVTTRRDNQMPVVKCDSINIEKIHSIAVAIPSRSNNLHVQDK